MLSKGGLLYHHRLLPSKHPRLHQTADSQRQISNSNSSTANKMSGFDTGSGTYDKVAQSRGGEGLDIDAKTAGELQFSSIQSCSALEHLLNISSPSSSPSGRNAGPGEGVSAGPGAKDNTPGLGFDGGPGSEDLDASVTGSGEGLDAGQKGNSTKPGGGVSLNAGREEEFHGADDGKFFDAEGKVQKVADKVMDKIKS